MKTISELVTTEILPRVKKTPWLRKVQGKMSKMHNVLKKAPEVKTKVVNKTVELTKESIKELEKMKLRKRATQGIRKRRIETVGVNGIKRNIGTTESNKRQTTKEGIKKGSESSDQELAVGRVENIRKMAIERRKDVGEMVAEQMAASEKKATVDFWMVEEWMLIEVLVVVTKVDSRKF